MNTRHKIDDLFKEALTGYTVEPSIGLWRRIERRFFPPSRFSPSGLITSIFLLIIAGSMPWILIPANNQDMKGPSLPAENARQGYLIKSATLDKAFSDQHQALQTAKIFVVEPFMYQEVPLAAGAMDPMDVMMPPVFQPVNAPPIPPLVSSVPVPGTSSAIDMTDPIEKYTAAWIYRMTSRRSGLMNTQGFIEESPLQRENAPASSFSGQYERSYFKSSEISIGASFIPTVVFYDPNPYNQMIGAEAFVRFNISDFSISSGIGYSRMEDIGSYRIDYKSLDSVGYFMDVVSFTVDPRYPEDIVLLLRQEAIYDSVPHYTLTEKNNYYSYIDIPLWFGYTFLNKGRVTLSAHAGMKFSLLVHKYEPTVDFTVTNGELIGIVSQVPARVNTTWRLSAGINFGYVLTDRLSLHLEPVFEQYISPVYTKQPGYEPRKPAVTGVKAGILFNL